MFGIKSAQDNPSNLNQESSALTSLPFVEGYAPQIKKAVLIFPTFYLTEEGKRLVKNLADEMSPEEFDAYYAKCEPMYDYLASVEKGELVKLSKQPAAPAAVKRESPMVIHQRKLAEQAAKLNQQAKKPLLTRIMDSAIDSIAFIVATVIELFIACITLSLMSDNFIQKAGLGAIGAVVVLFAVRSWVKGNSWINYLTWGTFAFCTCFMNVAFVLSTLAIYDENQSIVINIEDDSVLKSLRSQVSAYEQSLQSLQLRSESSSVQSSVSSLQKQLSDRQSYFDSLNRSVRALEDPEDPRIASYQTQISAVQRQIISISSQLDTLLLNDLSSQILSQIVDTQSKIFDLNSQITARISELSSVPISSRYRSITSVDIFNAIPNAIAAGRIFQLLFFSILFIGFEFVMVVSVSSIKSKASTSKAEDSK